MESQKEMESQEETLTLIPLIARGKIKNVIILNFANPEII